MNHVMQKLLVVIIATFAAVYSYAERKEVNTANKFVNYCEDSTTDEIVLKANISLRTDIELSKNLKILSDNNSRRTITAENSRNIKILPGCSLTLENVVFDGNSYRYRNEGLFYLDEAVKDPKTGTNKIARLELGKGTEIKNFTVTTTANADHAVIHVKKGARLVIGEGSMIRNCVNNSAHGNGGAICCDSGNVIMEGGVITGCKAKGSGGAIRSTGTRVAAEDHIGLAMRGDIVLYGGYITNNICGEGSATGAECYGGGIYLGDTGPMLHVIGPVVVSNNVCKVRTGGSNNNPTYTKIPDDVSTFELNDEYANRLKLTTDESHYQLKFTNGWVGVRYPDSRTLGDDDAQDKRFGGVWEYETTLQNEARQFFWNGDPTHKHRGWMKGNALVWSRYHMHELPRDAMKINELLSDEGHANEPVYVELTDDYTMRQEEEKKGIVGDGRRLIIDLQGHHFVSNLQVESGGQIEIADSSTNRAGKVSGNYVSTAVEGSDNRKKAYILHGGSYDKKPPLEWVSEDCVVIGNYCEIHPWMVARKAWEAELNASLADATLVPLETVDNEIRNVTNGSNLEEITYSAGDWTLNAFTNTGYNVRVLAAPAKEINGVPEEIPESRVLLFDTAVTGGIVDKDNIEWPESQPQPLPLAEANGGNAVSFSKEDTFVWNAKSYDLIKLIHITYRKSGAVETTNAIEQAYFRFPKAAFEATQRKTNDQLPITVVDQLLGNLGYNRAAGFSQGDVNAKLDAKENNGLRKWENIVTGTAADHLLVSSVEESENVTTLKVSMTEPNKSHRGDTGYSVFYDLKKSTENGWVRIGEVMNKPEFSVELTGEDGKSKNASGFYRVTTLIVPNDTLSVTNEIPSTNIIGVLEVASSFTNTMAAVPFVALSREATTLSSEPLTVSKYLHTKQLENDDLVRVANNGYVYQGWSWNSEAKKWEGLTTATAREVVSPQDPDNHQLSRDNVTWVTRSNPTNKPFFIIGQYSPDDITLTVAAGTERKPVCTLIPNPSLQPVKINEDYDWGENPHEYDQIRIINEKEAPVQLFRRQGKWYGWFVDENNVSYLTDDITIPAGHGFWYHRCGDTTFELKLPTSKPIEE